MTSDTFTGILLNMSYTKRLFQEIQDAKPKWSQHQEQGCNIEVEGGPEDGTWFICTTHDIELDYDGPEYDYDPEIEYTNTQENDLL